MRRGVVGLVLPVALGIAACGKEPVAPDPAVPRDVPSLQKGHVEGTGLLLESITGLRVPLIGIDLGDVVVKQAVIKEFGLVEDVVSGIVGLEATGVLEITGGLLGDEVVTQEFTTGVGVISTSRGQCDIITIDLSRIEMDVLGDGVFAEVPTATVTGRGNGALGSLLCNLGQLAQGLVNGVTRGAKGLINAINNLLI